jgi:hypothetical protein
MQRVSAVLARLRKIAEAAGPGRCAAGRALDTRGGAQYKAKENVYQAILHPRWILNTTLIPGDYRDAWPDTSMPGQIFALAAP